MSYGANYAATLACIKRVPLLDHFRPFESQIVALNLFGPASLEGSALTRPSNNNNNAPANGESAAAAPPPTSNPYGTLHDLVHLAVAPYFDAYVNSKGGYKRRNELASKGNKDQDVKTGIPAAKKRFAELELSLLHLQQNVEVPNVRLGINPIIQRGIDKCHAEGIRVSPANVLEPALLTDTTFLNRVQAECMRWVKDISDVTKLDRDVRSGTASQEVNFWLSMEKALDDIDEQLKSEPVELVIELLRNNRRYQMTTSINSDTGLKEASDIVHRYNVLMRDMPLNDLLAAGDLDKVQQSITAILVHTNRKIKLSPYPIRRALPLLEAVSQDLANSLLRVLGSMRLMYIDYDTFDRHAMKDAFTIFTIWDEHIKEFIQSARELTRRRSEKFLPIKIQPAHADLQNRLTYLRNFRRNHEQLRQMVSPTRGLITNMLQPGIAVANDEAGEDGAVERRTTRGLSEFDMEEEVRLAYEAVKTVDVLDISPGVSFLLAFHDGGLFCLSAFQR